MKKRATHIGRGKLDYQIQIAKDCRDRKDNASGSALINLAMLSAFHPHSLAVTSGCLPVVLVHANEEVEIPPGKRHLC